MKVYNKNGRLSRALRFVWEWFLAVDILAAAGTLFGLIFVCAIPGEPVPQILLPSCWLILGGNAAALTVYAMYILWRESRRIRIGVLSAEMICAIMEGAR